MSLGRGRRLRRLVTLATVVGDAIGRAQAQVWADAERQMQAQVPPTKAGAALLKIQALLEPWSKEAEKIPRPTAECMQAQLLRAVKAWLVARQEEKQAEDDGSAG